MLVARRWKVCRMSVPVEAPHSYTRRQVAVHIEL